MSTVASLQLAMRSFSPRASNRYRSQYTYDANGNIETVDRWDRDQNHYDAFSYKYEKRDGRLVPLIRGA
jgi:hypothetical protein